MCLVLFSSSMWSADWKAQWIEARRCQEEVNTWQMFRKQVHVDRVPQGLKAKIAVDSKYWLWVNGKMVVFEGQLKRGPSPLDTYYDEVDLSQYLKRGRNLIAVLAWFYGKEGFSHKNSGRAGFLFDAQGDGIAILSDETWEADVYDAYGACTTEVPNYRLPESSLCFDGRKDKGAWYSLGSALTLPKAKVLHPSAENEIYGKLVKRPVPLFRYSDIRKYEWTQWDAEKRVLRCKLPYNAQVTPWLKVKAQAGRTIDMRTEDFKVGNDFCIKAEYITRDGVQEYESYGWMNGNEVQYTIPQGVEVLKVGYRESGYDTDIVGGFQCNDPFWNELWKRSARTIYVNMRDTYFDCPDRERAQWWGDVVNDVQENFYVMTPTAWQLVNKGIYELMNWQRDDGTIYAPVPSGNWKNELPCQMLMSVGQGFFTQYYYAGDSSFVAPVYDRMHKYLHEVWQVDDDGFVATRKGGWSWADWGTHIDLELLTNEWYYLALSAEQRFAHILGKKGDEADILARMEKMEQNFERRYWSGRDYRSAHYREAESDDRAQAMAVFSGLAKAEHYDAIANILRTTRYASPLLELYVQEALFRMGQGKLALLRAREQYSSMLSVREATTVFEFWSPNASINHAWAAGMTVVFGRQVCGVRPTSPGFQTFEVAPQLAGLTDVRCNVQTPYGLIRVQLKQNGDRLKASVVVPKGTRAQFKWGGRALDLHAGNNRFSLAADVGAI